MSTKLFEFVLQKNEVGSTTPGKPFNYQVPAVNLLQAMILIGQTFNNSDKYELVVVEDKTSFKNKDDVFLLQCGSAEDLLNDVKVFSTAEEAIKWLELNYPCYEDCTESKVLEHMKPHPHQYFYHCKEQFDKDGNWDYPIETYFKLNVTKVLK